MNETECDNLIQSVKWTEPASLISLAILEFINVLVIGGNLLVIAAVFCSNKLRSVTNFFIVNLAVADLLVGLAVLPFSATWEVFKVWIFGDVWCRIWLAVDVWMCTASILNLCAISLDRYVAVTRPVTYPSIMSTKKAKSLIAGIWVLSFVICFPPLVGWKDKKFDVETTYNRGNYTLYYATSATTSTTQSAPPPPCRWKCELTNDRGYVLYSALGSFYIPMFVMLFFYWRIYRAAVRTTRAINQGFKTTKGSPKDAAGNRIDDSRLILRIHRGKPCSTPQRTPLSVHSMSSSLSMNSNCDDMPQATPKRATSMRIPRQRHEKIAIKVSFPSSENVLDSSCSSPPPYALVSSAPLRKSSITNGRRASFKSSLFEIGETEFNLDSTTDVRHGCGGIDSASPSPKGKKRPGKRSMRIQVKKFRMETKAAKTLAIIVGGFIFCWLPFFTMYLIRAFCEQCIEPLMFSILFWLGYCNSAINPLIYALFSNDFRIAFKRILCRCVCTRSGFRASENFQMIAARTLLAPANFHKTISGCNDENESSKGIGSRFEEQRLTLRIHRGRGSHQHDSTHSNGSTQSTTTTLGTPSPERLSKYSTRRSHHHHDKIKISVSYPSNENVNELSQSSESSNAMYSVHYTASNGRDTNETQFFRGGSRDSNNCYLQVGKSLPEMSRRQSATSDISERGRPCPSKKMGRRNIKAQVKRFRMETKAAKTLAIIVGMFVFCWLPFFTIYIIRPFCENCIDPLLFSILFWLGYCNSAVNPMIYALFSKDFRFAFKRIICRCFCSGQSISLKSSRRGSDMSQVRIKCRSPSITPSAVAHSFGDEHEHIHEMSEPR